MSFYHHILNPIHVQDMARSWIKEDLPSFDLQGIVVGDVEVAAKIFCKTPGVLAGIPFANAVFAELNCSPNWFFKEGEWLEPNPICEVAYVGGKAHNVLLAERTVLNVLSRCSGVATQSRNVKIKLDEMGWQGYIAGTRKTTPGFRMVEKYGLLIGGVTTHRYDLSNMIMLKDNHVSICGSIKKAIAQVRSAAGFANKIEVECRNFEEVRDAAMSAPDIIMLDNFKSKEIEAIAKWVKTNFPNILVEASGGITENNVTHFAKSSIDIISLGSLVQGYQTVDFSMKVLSSQN